MDSEKDRQVTVEFTFNQFGKPGQIDATVGHIQRIMELAGLDLVSMSHSYTDVMDDAVSA